MKLELCGTENMLPLRSSPFLAFLGLMVIVLSASNTWAATHYGASLYGESKKFWVGYTDNVGIAQISTVDGGAILVGSRVSYPDRDLVLLKIRPDGGVQWQQKINDTKVVSYQQNNLPANRYRGADVAATSDGNYVATFASESNKDVVTVAVIKFSDAGTILWSRTYSGNFSERSFPTHIVALSDSSLVVLGNLENQINRTFLMKIAGDGSLLSHVVLEDPNKNRYFKGRFLAKGVNDSLFVIASASDGDAIIRLDGDLNVSSLNHYFSDDVHVSLQSLQQRADGVIGIAATLSTGLDSNLGFIALHNNGRPGTAIAVNASAGDEASAIAVTDDGGFFVGGYTGAYAPSAPIQNTFVAAEHAFGLRVDPNGNFLWAKTYTTKQRNWRISREIVTDVAADLNGDLLMGGATYMSDHWVFLRLKMNAEGYTPGSSVGVHNGKLQGNIAIKSRNGSISEVQDTAMVTETKQAVTAPTLLGESRL